MWQVIQKRMGVTKASNFNVNHPFISEFKINIFSIPTCFAEARALFAEAILQKNRTKMAPRKLAEANF